MKPFVDAFTLHKPAETYFPGEAIMSLILKLSDEEAGKAGVPLQALQNFSEDLRL